MSKPERHTPLSARERAMALMLRHAEAHDPPDSPKRRRAKKETDRAACPPARSERPAQVLPQSPPSPLRRSGRELGAEEQERRRKTGLQTAERVLDGVLRGLGSSPDQARLSLLWRHWETVMGEALAPLARPLGHKDGILFVGADDAVSLQELHMQGDEILERVNAFMEKAFFQTVKVSLILGKAELDGPLRRAAAFEEIRTPLPCSAADGRYLESMDPASPVARAYARFAARRRRQDC